MMLINEFANEIKYAMMDRGFTNCEIKNVEKAGGTQIAIVPDITAPVQPVIYLQNFYEQYTEGESMDAIVIIIEDICKKASEYNPMEKTLNAWEHWKENVACELVYKKGNAEYLKDKITRDYLDFAIIYRVEVESPNESTNASFVITKENFGALHTTEDELDRIARENTRAKGVEFNNIIDTLFRMIKGHNGLLPEDTASAHEEETRVPMYMLSNRTGRNGAALIMYDDIFDRICKLLGTDKVFILPSSKHELLCIPKESAPSIRRMKEMVEEANSTVVDAPDLLSYNVYEYDVNSGKVSVCE